MEVTSPLQTSSQDLVKRLEEVKQRIEEIKVEYNKKINVLLQEIDTLHLEEIRKKIGI